MAVESSTSYTYDGDDLVHEVRTQAAGPVTGRAHRISVDGSWGVLRPMNEPATGGSYVAYSAEHPDVLRGVLTAGVYFLDAATED